MALQLTAAASDFITPICAPSCMRQSTLAWHCHFHWHWQIVVRRMELYDFGTLTETL